MDNEVIESLPNSATIPPFSRKILSVPENAVGFLSSREISETEVNPISEADLDIINMACMISAQNSQGTKISKLVQDHKNNLFVIPLALANVVSTGVVSEEIATFYSDLRTEGNQLTAKAVDALNAGDPENLAAKLGYGVKILTSMLI